MATRKHPHDHRPAILNALKRGPKSLAKIISAIGAQDNWDKIQRTLQMMRAAKEIEFRGGKWHLLETF